MKKETFLQILIAISFAIFVILVFIVCKAASEYSIPIDYKSDSCKLDYYDYKIRLDKDGYIIEDRDMKLYEVQFNNLELFFIKNNE